MIPVKSIYGIVQAERFWFKEYINAMTQKAVFKQCNTDPCILYRVNELRTAIFIVYIDDTLEIGVRPALIDTIECIKK